MRAPINERLLTASRLIRDDAVLADVGTDHAYLPIYMLAQKKIRFAVLSDINEGPLSKARENVRLSGFSNLVTLKLCNGASELAGLGITDYAVCGMGGELIAEIIKAAPHLKDSSVNLILQPMTRPEALRRFLCENGFRIIKELYVTDEGKHYVCMLASYSGECESFCDADIHFGRESVFYDNKSSSFYAYMEAKCRSLERVIAGKRSGGADCEKEEALLSSLRKRLEK